MRTGLARAVLAAAFVRVAKADAAETGAGIASAVDAPAPKGAKRRLRNLRVTFVSLVRRGANGRAIIAKADGADEAAANVAATIRLVKADAARRVVYGVVYAPDCVDSEGDTMTAADIEAASYRFMKDALTGAVDRQHDEEPIGGAYVAESWLVRKGDALFPKEPAGTWAVGIKVEDDATWADVGAGKIGGLSLMGEAQVEDLTTDPGTTDDGRQTTAKAGGTDSNEAAQEAPTTMNKQQEARGADATTILDRVRKALGLETSADADTVDVSKDYAGKRLAAQIQSNTWTLGDAIREALADGADAADVLASIDQFRAETAALLGVDETDKATPKKPKNVYRVDKTDDGTADDGAGAGSTDGAPDAADTVAQLAKSVADLTARLEALASTTDGRQSVDTREAPETVAKGKGYKGIRFVG